MDHGFEVKPDDPIVPGQILGWIEGFKAISDLYATLNGTFIASNPLLKDQIELVNRSPYEKGWLYAVQGEPDDRCVDVHRYMEHLDHTIDLILKQQMDEG